MDKTHKALYGIGMDDMGRLIILHPSGAEMNHVQATGVMQELLRQYSPPGFLSYDVALKDVYDRRSWVFPGEPFKLGYGVYFFKAENYPGEIKIGFVSHHSSYEARLSGLISKFGAGFYIAYIECLNFELVEKALHRIFWDEFKHGEFFTESVVLEWIEEISGRKPPSDEEILYFRQRDKLQEKLSKLQQQLPDAERRRAEARGKSKIEQYEERVTRLSTQISELEVELKALVVPGVLLP